MHQIVLKIGPHASEFYFPQNDTGFLGIEEVVMDIVHSEKDAKKASDWCKEAKVGEKYEQEAFTLEIRA